MGRPLGISGNPSIGSLVPRLEADIHPLARLLLVVYFVEVGLVLTVAPWSSFWDRNFFAEVFPLIGGFLEDNFVRGAVSGIGVVNLGAGMADLGAIFRDRHRGTGTRLPSLSITPANLRGRPDGGTEETLDTQ